MRSACEYKDCWIQRMQDAEDAGFVFGKVDVVASLLWKKIRFFQCGGVAQQLWKKVRLALLALRILSIFSSPARIRIFSSSTVGRVLQGAFCRADPFSDLSGTLEDCEF